jgi:hypothetical protein
VYWTIGALETHQRNKPVGTKQLSLMKFNDLARYLLKFNKFIGLINLIGFMEAFFSLRLNNYFIVISRNRSKIVEPYVNYDGNCFYPIVAKVCSQLQATAVFLYNLQAMRGTRRYEREKNKAVQGGNYYRFAAHSTSFLDTCGFARRRILSVSGNGDPTARYRRCG